MDDIIQLKITLNWTKPPIWRRVLVEKDTTFSDLHLILQNVMGWYGGHLYEFNVHKTRIGEPNEYDDFDDGDVLDASDVTLGSLIATTKEKFKYEYDFGDGWMHLITVEKFLPRDNDTNYPICTDGKMNCPPEDCGGVGGFYNLLEIIGNKKHPEHEEMLEWLGDDYDPEYFDKDEINGLLT